MNAQTEIDFAAPRYPTFAGYKREGTSSEAARTVDASGLRLAVIEKLSVIGPMTPDECAEAMGLSVLSIRPRFTELKRAGSIFETGMRRKNASGKSAEVCAFRRSA